MPPTPTATYLNTKTSPAAHAPTNSPPGFSGAELSNVVNEAAFLAARSANEAVGLQELVEAVQRTRWVGGGTREVEGSRVLLHRKRASFVRKRAAAPGEPASCAWWCTLHARGLRW